MFSELSKVIEFKCFISYTYIQGSSEARISCSYLFRTYYIKYVYLFPTSRSVTYMAVLRKVATEEWSN